MKLPENEVAPAAGKWPAEEEKRELPRFTLLIRSAKIKCRKGEFLCIVRDVSGSGLRLRLFHPLPPDETYTVELASGEEFAVEPIWEREGQAGLRFADPIDVHRFIEEASPYPKRAVRLRLTLAARISAGGEAFEATVLDVSRQGARIETSQPLAIGQRIVLEAEGMPQVDAVVCWRNAPAYGLVFRQILGMEDLARRAADLQLNPPKKRARPSPKDSAARRCA
ncbi:hypothetical protein GCM10011371_14220 [Novosphingobium marinum]|uniref:PilZ domain-containing protein n=1 Tax=Novosphingobium marinum TaxID=1514948 RepID=A0A7Y9XY71_9SPHN|nr:PilZ domain-containing protein [Novosphingobium marinum]NYH95535.1 hypothetical protein [Novosphingobium marinum]GGC27818.1 hypothetical protein GCM10011371_14220 [Novosphingobium marinum]